MPALCYAVVVCDRSHLLIAVACSLLGYSLHPRSALVRVNDVCQSYSSHPAHRLCLTWCFGQDLHLHLELKTITAVHALLLSYRSIMAVAYAATFTSPQRVLVRHWFVKDIYVRSNYRALLGTWYQQNSLSSNL